VGRCSERCGGHAGRGSCQRAVGDRPLPGGDPECGGRTPDTLGCRLMTRSGNMPTPLAAWPVARIPRGGSIWAESIRLTVIKRLFGLYVSESVLLQSFRAFLLLSLERLALLCP